MGKALFLLIIAFAMSATSDLVAEAQATRDVPYYPGVAITDLIKPGDRSVEIERLAPLKGFYSGKLPAADLIRAHALDVEAIVVVRIDQKTPHLTPQADWIETTYRASIIEQLRPRQPIASRNLRIDLDGGTLEIRGVTVTASADWEPRFEEGARYLLFVNQMRDPVDGIWAYKIGEKELLESTWNAFYTRGAADSIHGMPLGDARRVIIDLNK